MLSVKAKFFIVVWFWSLYSTKLFQLLIYKLPLSYCELVIIEPLELINLNCKNGLLLSALKLLSVILYILKSKEKISVIDKLATELAVVSLINLRLLISVSLQKVV